MRVRDTSFETYGFAPGEEKDLIERAKRAPYKEKQLLFVIANDVQPAIADDLYYSLVSGLSYDRLTGCKEIDYTKNDFYGYRRKCLAIYRNVFTTFEGVQGTMEAR